MNTKSLMSNITKLLIAALMLYVFWYQYAFDEISGLLMILGVMIAAAGCYWLYTDSGELKKSSLNGFIVVFILLLIVSSIVTQSKAYTSSKVIDIIEFLLIAMSVYLFMICDERNISFVLSFLSIAVVLLAVYQLLYGTEVRGGAIALGNLNPNLMSSMFTMGIYASFMVQHFGKQTRRNRLKKILFLSFIPVILYAQLEAASRRGFLVNCLIVILYIIYARVLVKHKGISGKKLFAIIATCAILAIILYFSYRYIMENTFLGQRFQGFFDTGDVLRERYHKLALKKFKEYPIFGIGLNSVAYFNHGVYSHSLYYELLACTGLLGCTAFAIYIFYLGKKLIMSAGKRGFALYSDDQVARIRTSIILLVCMAFSGFAVVMIYDLYFYLIFAFTAADYDMANKNIK